MYFQFRNRILVPLLYLVVIVIDGLFIAATESADHDASHIIFGNQNTTYPLIFYRDAHPALGE